MQRKLTRRGLIQMVGGGAGTAAAYATMQAMGLMATPAAYAGTPDLATGSGQGRSVAVLGAGVAGLVAAYELAKAGYEVTVLEATDHAGGRNLTFRAGDTVVEEGGTQFVDLDRDPDIYFNPGPGRIPYHHQALLGYCHELGVDLEPIVNDNRGAFFQDDAAFGGQPIRNRQVVNESRGVISEMLSKAVSKGALDEELDGIDKEVFLDFVSSFGDLGDGPYAGSSRAGYANAPGSGLNAPGDVLARLDLGELLASDFWGYKLHFGEGFTQAATMMQPVGGMDMIVKAFVERVGPMVTYNAAVTQIRRDGDGARVVYTGPGGAESSLTADHVICTIPFSVLGDIDTDFSPEVNQAIADCGYVNACKAAFQAERRFWEQDQQVYGGISWFADDITQIWYPTAGLGRQKGVIVGAYIWSDDIGTRFGEMSFADRLDLVIDQGSKIHPAYRDSVTGGTSIAWHKVPFQKGGWASWEDDARAGSYPAAVAGDGPFHFAGEHISYLTGWQEGSVLSAHDCISAIDERTRTADL
ncbi:MAG: flavin monoamine oxidase family protein [Pseudomonadota bacterium]